MSQEPKKAREAHLPKWWQALIPVIVLLVLMVGDRIGSWGNDPHIYVVITCAVTMLIGWWCGFDYKTMLAGMLSAIDRTMEAILILMSVGMLIGAWLWCGTISSIVYYGLNILTPKTFLPLGCIICGIVGISCGSSWTTTGTVGIAFMAIGAGLGINPAITAGMCISGAYMGDKFSPLSDSTNLAAAAGQTGLFDHVRAMASTTFPCFVIALILYAIIGINVSGDFDVHVAKELQDALMATQFLSPWLILPLLVIIAVCLLKVPALPGIFIAVAVGLIFAVCFQGATFSDCITACHYGFSAETGNELADSLLNRGGMDGMMWTINLAIVAIAFGGLLERCGYMEALLGGVIKKIKNVGGLVAMTIVTSALCDFIMCDQYLAIVIPGQMYQKYFDERGLGRNMLSRTLEDCGTLWSPLCPWNSCGAYQYSVLGVPNFQFFPYAFMNLINPIYAIVTVCLGKNIIYADGSRTKFFGKGLKQGAPCGAPEEAREIAYAALEKMRGEPIAR